MIKVYGEFWNPDVIKWGGRGKDASQLLGRYKFRNRWSEVDFWCEQGLYVLYYEFKAVYVGVAVDSFLGNRLWSHRKGRLRGRWDMFSWYGLDTPYTDGTLKPAKAKTITPAMFARLMEAVVIRSTDPPLNRQAPRFPGAQNVPQVVKDVD